MPVHKEAISPSLRVWNKVRTSHNLNWNQKLWRNTGVGSQCELFRFFLVSPVFNSLVCYSVKHLQFKSKICYRFALTISRGFEDLISLKPVDPDPGWTDKHSIPFAWIFVSSFDFPLICFAHVLCQTHKSRSLLTNAFYVNRLCNTMIAKEEILNNFHASISKTLGTTVLGKQSMKLNLLAMNFWNLLVMLKCTRP